MASPDAPVPADDMTCCGQAGSWSPKPGQPVGVSCILCPQSPSYYRRQARADGGPYQEVQPLAE